MIEIKPVKDINAVVRVPGSKSYTNRALVIGALTEGETVIHNALFSDDTLYMISALKTIGIHISEEKDKNKIAIRGSGGKMPVENARLFAGNAGTVMRFLTAMLTLGNGRYEIDGVERMRNRPIHDLIDGLNQLGADVRSKMANGCPPVLINGRGLRGGVCRVKGDLSSQYISALLMVAPYAISDVEIEIIGNMVSRQYIDMTIDLMDYFGVKVENNSYKRFIIKKDQRYIGREYIVEADASSASYFLAAAAITGGKVRVEGLGYNSRQGDIHLADVLEAMGCQVIKGKDWIEVKGGILKGVDVDLSDMPDIVQTLAAVAIFADGKTRIRNVKNLRIKETDRIRAVVNELRRIGVGCAEYEDGLEIMPSNIHPAEIETYDDHRMAMSFSIIGLRAEGIKIKNPACVSKTFPGFFEELARLDSGRR